MNDIHEELKEIKNLLKEVVKMFKNDRETIAMQSDLNLINGLECIKIATNKAPKEKGKLRRLLRTFKKIKNKSKGYGIGSTIEENIAEKHIHESDKEQT